MSRHSGLDWASIVAFIMVMLVLALLCVVTIANRKAASGTNRQADVPDAGTANEEPTVRTVSYNGKIFECLSFPLPAYDGSSQHCNLCTERTENDYKSGTPPRYFACWR